MKLGPIALTFATDVSRASSDEAAGVVTLSAKAREKRGRGGAQAQIESSLTRIDGGTRVDIVTDLTLSGAVAQYEGAASSRTCRASSLPASPTASRHSWRPRPRGRRRPPRRPPRPSQQQAKPVSGISLGVGAFLRSIGRMFGRMFGKSPESR